MSAIAFAPPPSHCSGHFRTHQQPSRIRATKWRLRASQTPQIWKAPLPRRHCGRTLTGGRVITVRGPMGNGKHHLEIRCNPRASSKRADLKSITSLHEDYPGKPGFLGCSHHKSWVTEAAARAAIDHFRAWVDGGRRKQTAAATARSIQPAAEDVVLLPERYSERRNFRVRVGAKTRRDARPCDSSLRRGRQFDVADERAHDHARRVQPRVEPLLRRAASSAVVFDKKFCHADE